MKSSASFRLWISAFWLLLPNASVHGQCYYPNGDPSKSDDQPCSSNGHSACCPLNWECLSNGLCYLENEGYFGRYTCTDQSWQSEGCPNICTQDKTASGNEAILECSKGSYCCDANRPPVGCCETSNDFFTLPDGTVIASIGANGPVAAGTNAADSPVVQTSSPAAPTVETSSSDTPTSETTSTETPTDERVKLDVEAPSVVTSVIEFTSSVVDETNGFRTITSASPESTSEGDISPSVSISVILLTSVVINSAGLSSNVGTSRVIGPQSTTASSPVAVAQSASDNLGIKIGLGVGIPVGVIALGLLGFLLWKFRRRKGGSPPPADMAEPAEHRPMDYMYKGNVDIGTPLTATTGSPDLNQRASSKYVVHDTGEPGYRGVQTGGLGSHQASPGLPKSPARSELSGEPARQRDSRFSQRSELAGSKEYPSELPEQAYR